MSASATSCSRELAILRSPFILVANTSPQAGTGGNFLATVVREADGAREEDVALALPQLRLAELFVAPLRALLGLARHVEVRRVEQRPELDLRLLAVLYADA